jgi:hypothetical protein
MPRRQQAGDCTNPLVSYRNRASAERGRAAEDAWCLEQRRCGAPVAWSSRAGTSARHNRDILDCWDTIAVTPHYTVLSQVKATATEPRPDHLWRVRFMAHPHPRGLLYLLVWWTPEGNWQVWRLLPDGTRLPVDWPPERNAS